MAASSVWRAQQLVQPLSKDCVPAMIVVAGQDHEKVFASLLGDDQRANFDWSSSLAGPAVSRQLCLRQSSSFMGRIYGAGRSCVRNGVCRCSTNMQARNQKAAGEISSRRSDWYAVGWVVT